jgi:sugar-specific transcriptional regulator TrmB
MDAVTLGSLGVDLKKEYDRIAETLESLGLSNYEARAYIALVAHGYGSAETISQTASIPRTSAYKVLQALCEKGYAISTRGRPQMFRPESPGSVKRRAVQRISDTFDKLEMVHEVLRDRGEPQLVYTIAGKDRVMEKIGELLDQSTVSFMIATPTLSEIRTALKKRFESAMDRRIKVTIITDHTQKVPEGATAIRRKGLVATDVICDGKVALIASPDLDACGYTSNESLAEHLENFLNILAEDRATQ